MAQHFFCIGLTELVVLLWMKSAVVCLSLTSPFSLPFSPSGGMLSGFWFEFSRTHCCGCGSQLPNHPSAYLLPDWPAEESHWLPVCITQAAAILPLTPACPLPLIFAPLSSAPVGFLFPCDLLDPPPHLPVLTADDTTVSNMSDCANHFIPGVRFQLFMNDVVYFYLIALNAMSTGMIHLFSVSSGCLNNLALCCMLNAWCFDAFSCSKDAQFWFLWLKFLWTIMTERCNFRIRSSLFNNHWM